MRVLVSANPMFGHVNPVLPLVAAATQLGHDVVVATGGGLVEHVERHVDARRARVLPMGRPDGTSRVGDESWLAHFARMAGERVGALVAFADQWRPDVVVHEETELAGAIAAMSTGARHVVHGIGIPPPPRIWDVMLPELDDLGRVHGVRDAAERMAAATYLDLCPASLRPEHGVPWHDVRPARPAPALATDHRAADVVGRTSGRPTVHVTLGTVFNGNARALRTAIDAVAQLDVDVVATTGPGTDPEALGTFPENVCVRDYLPHHELLPRCAAVVSQGGAGVMFASLSHGLPQLLLPQGGDQFGNARACEDAGVALALVGDQAATAEIATAVGRLLTEPRFAVAATRVRGELEAMPPIVEVLAAIASEERRRDRAGYVPPT